MESLVGPHASIRNASVAADLRGRRIYSHSSRVRVGLARHSQIVVRIAPSVLDTECAERAFALDTDERYLTTCGISNTVKNGVVFQSLIHQLCATSGATAARRAAGSCRCCRASSPGTCGGPALKRFKVGTRARAGIVLGARAGVARRGGPRGRAHAVGRRAVRVALEREQVAVATARDRREDHTQERRKPPHPGTLAKTRVPVKRPHTGSQRAYGARPTVRCWLTRRRRAASSRCCGAGRARRRGYDGRGSASVLKAR